MRFRTRIPHFWVQWVVQVEGMLVEGEERAAGRAAEGGEVNRAYVGRLKLAQMPRSLEAAERGT